MHHDPPPRRVPSARPGRTALVLVLGVAAALLLLVSSATGYPEKEAANLRLDIAGAGHEPLEVAPHTQWSGFLTLTPDSTVTAASYQICRVGTACFAPPAPAARTRDTFRFNTTDVPANAVDYQAGWHIGVKWILTDRDGNQTAFPQGPDLMSPACQGDASLSCQEQQYLTFFIASEPAKPSPPPAAAALALACLAAAALRLRSGRHA